MARGDRRAFHDGITGALFRGAREKEVHVAVADKAPARRGHRGGVFLSPRSYASAS